MNDFSELNRIAAEMEQAMVPDDLKAKGWVYKDLPSRLTPEAWNLFLNLIGDGEYQCIAMTSGSNKYGPYKRGQFFISPQGMANMADKERLSALRSGHQ